MAFYSFKLGMNAGARQPEILQALKSNGDDAIQTSDGLCVKSARSAAELNQWLAEKKFEGISVQEVKGNEPGLAKDVEAFLKS